MLPATIRDKFLELVRGRYFERCASIAPPPDPSAPPPAEDAPPPPPRVEGVPPLVEPEGERAFMPPQQLDMAAVHRAVEGRTGKPPPADPIRWRVNFSRLDEEFRSVRTARQGGTRRGRSIYGVCGLV